MGSVGQLGPTEVAELGSRLGGEHRPRREGPAGGVAATNAHRPARGPGDVLIEDYPGGGQDRPGACAGPGRRRGVTREIQCTSDMLPFRSRSGTNVFNQRDARFEFRPGPVFANLVLADEINRAPPKTQSALLECMQEHRVTVGGRRYDLARPSSSLRPRTPLNRKAPTRSRGAARPFHVRCPRRLSLRGPGGGDARRARSPETRYSSSLRVDRRGGAACRAGGDEPGPRQRAALPIRGGRCWSETSARIRGQSSAPVLGPA